MQVERTNSSRQHAKLRGQTPLCDMLAKFLETPTEHTDPLSSTNIWRSAHLHGWVFMVRSCSRGQFNSSDPKAPNVCLEIISSDLKNKSEYVIMCLLLSYTTISFTHPFPTSLERPALEMETTLSPFSPRQLLIPSRKCFRSHSLWKPWLCTVQPGLLCHKLHCRT